jgi:hypothetical protein
MAALLVLGMLAFAALFGVVLVFAVVVALLKLVFLLVVWPLRLAFNLVLLPVRLLIALLLLPFALLVGVGALALTAPLLPFAAVALLVYLLMRRAPARVAS